MKRFLLLAIFFSVHVLHAAHVTIIGCGYVGLTLAAILSQCDHHILCIDLNKEKITDLQQKRLPLYEPHLAELLFQAPSAKNISFTTDLHEALESEILYFCVDTPTNSDKSCESSHLFSVFKEVIEQTHNSEVKILCIKSTIPPGTMKQLTACIPRDACERIQLVYNPEFMREGSAIRDILTVNPLILAGHPLALEKIHNLYRPLLHDKIPVIKTDFETAEIIKYAWNSFSALRITYVNELSILCRKLNAEISTVIKGIAASEALLETKDIKPGPGYGGSCLPKDIALFSKIMEYHGFDASLIHQTIESNRQHQEKIINDIFSLLAPGQQHIVTILGLSFKADTNDIRNSPAISIIRALQEKEIVIKAYDARALFGMQQLFPSIHYFDSPYEAIKNTDLIIILTDCETIKNLDLEKISHLCKTKALIDTRNIYNPDSLKKYGFNFINMGLQ